MRNGLSLRKDSPESSSLGIFDPLFRMRSEMDRMMDGFMGLASSSGPSGRTGNFFSTKLNTSEDSNNYYLEFELLGVKRDQVEISLEDGQLIVEGSRLSQSGADDQPEGGEQRKFHQVESSYGHFRRSMSLPRDANQEEISAKFEDGILHVTLPRKNDETSRTRIEIED